MAGHPGNQGGGSSGAVGAVGGGDFVPVLPDRVDLPFVTDTVYDAAIVKISDQTTGITVFLDRRWSAEWRAWYALSEYVQTNWSMIPPIAWTDPTAPGPANDPKSEIEKLVIAARDERADALGEIVAQHDGFANYFFALLTVDPAMYPATNLLINIASIFAASMQGDMELGVKGIAIPLKGSGGDRFAAHVLPLTSGARRKRGFGQAVAALFVSRATFDAPSALQNIAKAFGLTPMELRVLLAIVEVGGVPEVATALGVAETTVKSHLRGVFAKTGAGRQADLGRVLN